MKAVVNRRAQRISHNLTMRVMVNDLGRHLGLQADHALNPVLAPGLSLDPGPGRNPALVLGRNLAPSRDLFRGPDLGRSLVAGHALDPDRVPIRSQDHVQDRDRNRGLDPDLCLGRDHVQNLEADQGLDRVLVQDHDLGLALVLTVIRVFCYLK